MNITYYLGSLIICNNYYHLLVNCDSSKKHGGESVKLGRKRGRDQEDTTDVLGSRKHGRDQEDTADVLGSRKHELGILYQ